MTTFQPRMLESGGVCCSSADAFCDTCRTFHDKAPDPYESGLQKMRAASETPTSTFEESWKQSRFAALDKEHAEIDAIAATQEPRLTAAELQQYAAPDPYREGIKALQARDARARDAKERR